MEKFSHDTVIAFTSPSELSDTTLSSTVPLRTASASSKSSINSLRRKRLAEIAESSGENQYPATKNTDLDITQVPSREIKSASGRIDHPGYSPERTIDRSKSAASASISPSRARRDLDKSLPAIPSDSIYRSEPAVEEIGDNNLEGRQSVDRRQSSQSARPLTQDSFGGYHYRSKTKLGPRPSLEYSGRPSITSSYLRQSEPRPVSSLPAGVRVPLRKPLNTTKPQPQQPPATQSCLESGRVAADSTPLSSEPSSVVHRPTSRAGSIASVSTLASEQKHPPITPEKQRLMKALQIRQRQMAKRIAEESPPTDSATQLVVENVFRKVADDDPALRVLDHVSPPEEDCDIVHVGIKDLGDPLRPQASPISIPEPSEGPSTQASSVADTEESTVNQAQPQGINVYEVLDGQQTARPMDVKGANDLLLTSYKIPYHEPPTVAGPTKLDNRNTILASVEPHEIPLPAISKDEETTLQACPSLDDETIAVPTSTSVVEHASLPTDFPPQVIPLLERPVTDLRATNLATDMLPQDTLPNTSTTVSLIQPSPQNIPFTDPLIASSLAADPLLADSPRSKTNLADPVPDQGKQISNPRVSIPDTTGSHNVDRKTKKRGLLEPIQVLSTGETSDDNYLSDDSFMEELQSATLQEAKPISVSRSPITPVFPRSPRLAGGQPHVEPSKLAYTILDPPNEIPMQDHFHLPSERPWVGPKSVGEQTLPKMSSSYRAVSSPLDLDNPHSEQHLSPKSSNRVGPRSVSSSPTHRGHSEYGPTSMSKKLGVSTGISQRIKALEKFSSSPTSQSPTALTTPVTSPAFVTSRKTSIDTPVLKTGPPDSNSWRIRRKIPFTSPSPSPIEKISISNGESSSTSLPATPKRAQAQSISVTAKIVRDDSNQKPEIPSNLSEPVIMNLHHSPLIVEHQNSFQPSIKSPLQSPKSRESSVASNSSSAPESKRDALLASRRDSYTSRRSTSSRKGSDGDGATVLSETSSNGLDGTEGSKDEKKESRRGRIFKRMSSMTSASRRSIVHALSPTVKEEESVVERQEPTQRQVPLPTMDVGDVNVQFPDTLVCIPHG